MSKLTSTMAMIAAMAVTLWSQVPTEGLVAFYPFTGNLLDASGHGHKLDSLHTTDQRYLTKYVNDRNGTANRADSFPGTTCGLFTSADSFPTGASARTISAWVKLGILSQPRTIVAWGDKANKTECSFLVISTGGFAYLIFTNGTDSLKYKETNTARIQSWTHLAVSLTNAGLAKMYMDDSLLVSKQMSNWNTSAGLFGVGAWFINQGAPNDPWSGCVDAVAVYKKSLTDTEITMLANNTTDQLIPTKVSIPNNAYYTVTKTDISNKKYTINGRTTKNESVTELLVDKGLKKTLQIQ